MNACDICGGHTPGICYECFDKHNSNHNDCVDEAFDCGAAIAFGIIGMAEAIRGRYFGAISKRKCKSCGRLREALMVACPWCWCVS